MFSFGSKSFSQLKLFAVLLFENDLRHGIRLNISSDNPALCQWPLGFSIVVQLKADLNDLERPK